MARTTTVFALFAEEGAQPLFYPTRKLARQAFDWIVEDRGEPTIRRVIVPLCRQGICDTFNEWMPS